MELVETDGNSEVWMLLDSNCCFRLYVMRGEPCLQQKDQSSTNKSWRPSGQGIWRKIRGMTSLPGSMCLGKLLGLLGKLPAILWETSLPQIRSNDGLFCCRASDCGWNCHGLWCVGGPGFIYIYIYYKTSTFLPERSEWPLRLIPEVTASPDTGQPWCAAGDQKQNLFKRLWRGNDQGGSGSEKWQWFLGWCYCHIYILYWYQYVILVETENRCW